MYVKIHFFLARFARKFNYHYLQHLLAMLGVDTYNCFPFCRYFITLPESQCLPQTSITVELYPLNVLFDCKRFS